MGAGGAETALTWFGIGSIGGAIGGGWIGYKTIGGVIGAATGATIGGPLGFAASLVALYFNKPKPIEG